MSHDRRPATESETALIPVSHLGRTWRHSGAGDGSLPVVAPESPYRFRFNSRPVSGWRRSRPA